MDHIIETPKPEQTSFNHNAFYQNGTSVFAWLNKTAARAKI